MPSLETRWTGWRGVSLIAITYVYFLIFAQFAFLRRLANLGIVDDHLKAVMAAMALGGISLSLITPRVALLPSPRIRLRIALAVCALAALLSLLPLGLLASITVSLMIGAGLGLLTVTLVAHLRGWLGERHALLQVGLGTGLGYLVCNIPPFFSASPEAQATAAAILCLAGILVTPRHVNLPSTQLLVAPKLSMSFFRVLVCFTALVWLDSAAFFIIQNTPALRAGAWQGTVHLLANGLLHLAAALVSAWYLRLRGLSSLLSFAFLALTISCLLLLNPSEVVIASVFYPVGVSLYSVALVAYPSLLAPATSQGERAQQTGWIYSIAGWFGSAMGIGMGQNLGHVPVVFVALAGGVILTPQLLGVLRRRTRESVAVALSLLVAFGLERMVNAIQGSPVPLSQVERGKQVYISEGCINCHSQYVRPNTHDVVMWGPVQTLDELRRERPPLIGNRRQGPDLAEVGNRRSPLWLKAHFYNPAGLSRASFMPSYAYLYRDGRGDDLVAYLQSLRGAGNPQHVLAENAWRPTSSAIEQAAAHAGRLLFQANCSTCHASDGPTRLKWQASFRRLPPDLSTDPLLHLRASDSTTQQFERLAHIVKFGLPGTDMPGHEYMPDESVASISAWLMQNLPPSARNQQHGMNGENQ